MSLKIQSQDKGFGNWFSAQVRVDLSGKWEWHNDAGYRTVGSDWQASQFLYRTGLRYKLNDHHTVASGIALFYTSVKGEKEYSVYGEERRIWQEYALESEKRKWQFQGRFRSEERFFQAVSFKPALYATRIRLRISATRYLNEHWGIQLANEYMYQWDQGTGKFNQYRAAITGLYDAKMNWQFQMGYMMLQWPQNIQHTIILIVQKKFKRNGN